MRLAYRLLICFWMSGLKSGDLVLVSAFIVEGVNNEWFGDASKKEIIFISRKYHDSDKAPLLVEKRKDLERLAKDRFITYQTVTNELLAQDFQPRGKQFSTSVYTTLTRLAERERINQARREGKLVFSYKNGSTPKMEPARS